MSFKAIEYGSLGRNTILATALRLTVHAVKSQGLRVVQKQRRKFSSVGPDWWTFDSHLFLIFTLWRDTACSIYPINATCLKIYTKKKHTTILHRGTSTQKRVSLPSWCTTATFHHLGSFDLCLLCLLCQLWGKKVDNKRIHSFGADL